MSTYTPRHVGVERVSERPTVLTYKPRHRLGVIRAAAAQPFRLNLAPHG